MWKDNTILMINKYPFQENTNKKGIRKRINTKQRQSQQYLLLTRLQHQTLININTIIQEGLQLWFVYQIVPHNIQDWVITVKMQYVQNYQQKMIMFSRFLADNNIVLTFKKQHMGVNSNDQPKYYLDFNFTIDPLVDKISLKKSYKQQIRQLMQQFIDRKKQRPFQHEIIKQEINEKQKIKDMLKMIQKQTKNLKQDLAVKNKQNNKKQTKKQQTNYYLKTKEQSKLKFQQIKYKQYKNIKTSGQDYVQDFLNVLEAQQFQKLSPRFQNLTSKRLSIHPSTNKISTRQLHNQVQMLNQSQIIEFPKLHLTQKISQKQPKILIQPKSKQLPLTLNKAQQLQKRVEQTIANSLLIINKLKQNKNKSIL